MSSTIVLAIDVGTTNWKAALFDENSELIDQRSMGSLVEHDGYGTSYNPDTLWESIAYLISCLVQNRQTKPNAICVTSMAEAGFPLDINLSPLYNAITWYDQRSYKQAMGIEDVIGKDSLFNITGLEPSPVFTLSKILWFREQEPSIYKNISHWLSIADYINFRLCGEIITDYSLACRTQCFDIKNKCWSQDITKEFGIPISIFPEVKKAGTIVGFVTSEVASKTGLLSGTPVILGGHDHHCAFLAGGALLQEGTIFDSSGTVESIMTLLPKNGGVPNTYNNMRVGNFIDPDRYVVMGGILASGGSVEWMLNQIWKSSANAQINYDEVMCQISGIPPGSDGLLFLPHISGAGAPYWEPRSKGAFIGLTLEHTKRHFLHSVFEGLCFELLLLLSSIERTFDIKTDALHTVGGGAKNWFWQQLKADITNKIVHIPDVNDATAQGASLIAGVGIGIYKDFEEGSKHTWRLRKTFYPQEENREVYTELLQIYKIVYDSVIPIAISLDGFKKKHSTNLK